MRIQRGHLRKIEEMVSAQEIISIRSIQQQKFKSAESKQADLDELEAKIKKKIWEKKGFGLFISAQDKQKLEDEVRESFRDERQKIEDKYVKMEEKLSDQVSSLVKELNSECLSERDSPTNQGKLDGIDSPK